MRHVSEVARGARATKLHPRNAAPLAAVFREHLQADSPKREFCFCKSRGKRTMEVKGQK